MRSVRSRLTYANVMSSMAVFMAMGGGAYAAVKIPANSVGTAQVIDASLLAKDFQAGQLPAGGVSGLQVVTATSGGGPGGTKDIEAPCPAGKKVTGGGSLVSGGAGAVVTTSAPGQVPNPTSWYVAATQPTANAVSWTLTAYAVCANTQ